MKRTPPPLRFLLLVVGGWMCVRTAAYAPGWWLGEGVAGPVEVATPPRPASGTVSAKGAAPAPGRGRLAALPSLVPAATSGNVQPIRLGSSTLPQRTVSAFPPTAVQSMSLLGSAASMPESISAPAPPALRVEPAAAATPDRHGRWSGSAWLLLRREEGSALAQGGTLGGSQAGIRIGYRLNREGAPPLSLAARIYAPAGDRRAAEAALGVEWRPIARLPLSLAAERRQALGSHGRSAFALGAHGGVNGARLAAGVRLDAYAQAGIVGTGSRDLYVDAATRVTLPAGRFDVGAGLSGGAQPGVARLDAGPVVSLRLPAARLRVSTEWRFRIAGDARPDSGPVLTVGADF